MHFPSVVNRRVSLFHAAATSLIVLIGFGLLGTSSTARAQEATPEATPPVGELKGQIIYAGKQSGNFEIYIMNEDGSHSRNLTNNRVDDQIPLWSPDGTLILFQTKRDGNSQIYTMNPDGSNPINLSSNAFNESIPNWSPDGQKIAFASDRDGNSEIYVMNADGSDAHRLTNNDFLDSAPVWTPDGKQIVYTAEDPDKRYRQYIMNADGSEIQRFLPSQPLLESADPVWSPDGTKIALSAFVTPAIHAFVVDADGTNPQQLTSGSSDDSNSPSWSPDGTQIVYVHLHANRFNVYVMNADGSDAHALTTNADYAQSPSWAITTVVTPPVAASIGTATVNSHGSVNMRSGAGTNNPAVASVPGGTTVSVLGFNDDHTWVNVRLDDDSEGWISASLLTVSIP